MEDTPVGPDEPLNELEETGLYLAVLHGNLEATRMMVEFGADVHHVVQSDDSTAVTLAASLGLTDILEALCQSPTFNKWPWGGPRGLGAHISLHDATWNGHLQVGN